MRFLKSLLRGLAVVATLGALTIVNAATDFNQIAGNTPMYTAADVDGLVATLQPLDSDLTAVAGLTTTAHGLGLLDDADPAASRTTLGVVIGTNVQAWDADLDAVAALATNAYGLGLLQTATNSAARTYLGLGTAATQSSGAFAAASHTHDAGDVTTGTLDGDRLPGLSTTKRGGVPATGTPSGKFLKDDGTWASPSSGGVSDGDYGDITVSGTGATWTVDSGAVSDAELSVSDVTTNNVSTSAHGFVPKAPNDTTKFLRGDATWAVPSFPGRIHKITTLSVGTTSFTPDASTTMMMVECWGAGGGGGGADGGSSQAGCGAGGGGGGYRVAFVTTMRAGYTTSIPNGANGGTAGNNSGSTASDTQFYDTAGAGANLTVVAKGGVGGGSMAAGTTVVRATPGAGGGAGSTSGSDAAWSQGFNGGYGGAGLRFSATICISGDGGGAPRLTGPDAQSVNGSTVGESAGWIGGGGSGGAANSTTDRAGGSGSPGLIIVTEYK